MGDEERGGEKGAGEEKEKGRNRRQILRKSEMNN